VTLNFLHLSITNVGKCKLVIPYQSLFNCRGRKVEGNVFALIELQLLLFFPELEFKQMLERVSGLASSKTRR